MKEVLNTQEEQNYTTNAKALRIDISGILKQFPEASSANIFYIINNDEVKIIGMEVLNNEQLIPDSE